MLEHDAQPAHTTALNQGTYLNISISQYLKTIINAILYYHDTVQRSDFSSI